MEELSKEFGYIIASAANLTLKTKIAADEI